MERVQPPDAALSGNSTIVFDGAVTQTFGANNTITPSGEAQMRVGGAMVARIVYNTQGKLVADVSAAVPVW